MSSPLYSTKGAASSCAKHARRPGVRGVVKTGWVTLERLKRDIDRGWRFFFNRRHMPLPKLPKFRMAGLI